VKLGLEISRDCPIPVPDTRSLPQPGKTRSPRPSASPLKSQVK
jgi:hypothetical protein